jgi:large subunit ribosomal protein L11e
VLAHIKEIFVNKMRDIHIVKLVFNLSTGESGDMLTKAAEVLEDLTDQKPVESYVCYKVRTHSIKSYEKMVYTSQPTAIAWPLG